MRRRWSTTLLRNTGSPVPEFQPVRGSTTRVALTTDPDGQPVELIVVPNATTETLAQIEIGLTVADIERSRTFYREFIGLEEQPPVEGSRSSIPPSIRSATAAR